jgi:hypothetical protein
MQEEAKRRFIYRYTGEHKPRWAMAEWKPGIPYPVHFKNDNDWLAHTIFVLTDKGEFPKGHKNSHCISNPTYPNNPELRLRS